MQRDKSWLHQLTPRHVSEIDAVVEHLRRNRRTLETVTGADFAFPTLGVFLRRFLWHDIGDRGFGVVRGLPVERYSAAEAGMVFWGLGTHMGTPVSQSPLGERLGDVRSTGADLSDLNARGYQTSAELAFHNDPGDVVGLLCLKKAKLGGLSSLVSAISVYNTVLAERPDCLGLFERGFEYNRRDQEARFLQPISHRIPVFADEDGDLSMRYVRQLIDTARVKLGAPLPDAEREALDFLDSVARRSDLVVSLMLEPGDMEFANNYTVLHSRTRYEDHADPAQWRHLNRLWLKIPGFRKLDLVQIELDRASGWSRRDGVLPANAPMPIRQTETDHAIP